MEECGGIGEGGSAALRGGQRTEAEKTAAGSGEQGDGFIGPQPERFVLKAVGDGGQPTEVA